MSDIIENELPAQVPTGLSLDTVKFLKEAMIAMINTHDYAYPDGYLKDARCHAALQKLKGQIGMVQTFLNALK